MTKEEVFDILNTIAAAYPQFDIDEKRANVWLDQLSEMPYKKVIFNLNQHISNNRFPPAIAEIAAQEKPKNEHLEKIKQWEKESIYARKHRS